MVLPGLIGLALFHDELGSPFLDQSGTPNQAWNGDSVLPKLITSLLPTGVLGLVVGAFLAGVLSNLDSYNNSASTLVVTDLYRPLVRRARDRHYLLVGRWLVVGFLAAGAVAALFGPASGLGVAALILTVSDSLVLIRLGAGFDKAKPSEKRNLFILMLVILLLYYVYMGVLIDTGSPFAG